MAIARTLTFADLLRRHRRAAGLSQEELAERAGLSRNGISELERGLKRAPHKDTVARLAEGLQLGGAERASFEAAARGRSVSPAGPVWTAPRTPARPASQALVGRAHELARLDRFLAGDAPPLLLLSGEPGIGKSRLLQEAAEQGRAAGWTVLEGGCQRRAGLSPFAPLLEALAHHVAGRTWAQRRGDLEGAAWLVRLLPELAEMAVVPAPGWTLPPEQERRLMFAAVARYLANIAGPAGTLLVLDDLQWAGGDALDLLGALVSHARLALASNLPPLLVLGAYRSTEVHAEHPLAQPLADLARDELASGLPLGPLAREEARSLLEHLLDGGEDDEARAALVARLLERAGGVPFYLVSCARATQSEAERTGGAYQSYGLPVEEADVVPWDAAQSIRQRVAGLPRTAQDALRVAAVAGRTVTGSLLGTATELSEAELVGALEAICQARLLIEPGDAGAGDAYQFAHDLIREVVEADLSAARRRLLHRKVGDALEARVSQGTIGIVAVQLAFHYGRAGVRAKALHYTLCAGDAAAAVYAHSEAVQHYRAALDLARSLEDREREAQVLEKLGDMLIMLNEYDAARAAIEQAIQGYRVGGKNEGAARSAALLGEVYAHQGALEEGAQRLQAILATLDESATPSMLATVSLAIGRLRHTAGRYEEALEVAQRALALSRADGDKHLEAKASHLVGLASGSLGQLSDAVAHITLAAGLLEESDYALDLAFALSDLTDYCRLQGQAERAQAHVERAMACAWRVGDLTRIAWIHLQIHEVAFLVGQWRRARTELDTAAAMLAGLTGTWEAAYLDLLGGRLDLAQGRHDSALSALRRAIRYGEQIRDPQMFRNAHHDIAEYELLGGDADCARKRLDPLLDGAEHDELGITHFLALLGWAHAAYGDLPAGETIVGQAVERARRGDAGMMLAEALPIRAHVALLRAEFHVAEAALDEALALCRTIPYPWAEAKALYVYGQLHAARNEPEPARERLEAALAICDRLGEGLYRPHIEKAMAVL